MNHKLTNSIIIIAYIFTTLFLIGAIWFGYENLQSVRASTGELDKSINEVVIEWSADYARDAALLEQIDKDLAASEARIDKLIKEAEEIINE